MTDTLKVSSITKFYKDKRNVEFNFSEFGYFIDAQLIIKKIAFRYCVCTNRLQQAKKENKLIN